MEGLGACIGATVLVFELTPLLTFVPLLYPTKNKTCEQGDEDAGSEDQKANPVVLDQPESAIRVEPSASAHRDHCPLNHEGERDH